MNDLEKAFQGLLDRRNELLLALRVEKYQRSGPQIYPPPKGTMEKTLCHLGLHKWSKWLPGYFDAKHDARFCTRCPAFQERKVI